MKSRIIGDEVASTEQPACPSDLFFAHRLQEDGRTRYAHFYSSRAAMRLCGDDPVVVLEVREVTKDEEPEFWGWFGYKDMEVHFIYPAPALVSLCFPSGSELAEKRGEGRIVALTVREVEDPGVHLLSRRSRS